MIAIFTNKIKKQMNFGKWLTIFIIFFLCIFQIYTLNEIYHNTKENYSNQIFDNIITKTYQTNLIKSSQIPLTYCAYDAEKHEICIVKLNENIDTLIALNPTTDFRVPLCQASYDIRDTNIWNLDTLGQMLIKAFASQALSTNFKLRLHNEKKDILTTFQYGNFDFYLPSIHQALDLGFLEHHKLTITFNYPFHYFWKAAWDRIITTGGLFFLLIFLSVSLFIQLRDERRTNEYRKKFTHTLVHNLRSPLLSSKQQLSALQLLQLSPGQQQEAIRICLRKTTAVLKDIEKLLSTSVNAYGLVAHREIFHPEELIQKITTIYQQNAPDKKVYISNTCQQNMTIYGDPTLLEGAIGNLVGNSIIYSGTEVHIHITCRKINKKVLLSVQDDGFGIAPEERPYIFQENFRGIKYQSDRNHKGFGLGLYYVQAVVKAHRGQITVESDGQNGSTFTFELPEK